MHFEVRQPFAAPLGVVEAAFLDPGYVARLGELPRMGPTEFLDQRREGDVVHQRVRYRYAGPLPPGATRFIDPARLSWVEESTVDLGRHRTDIRLVPDHYPNRLEAGAVMELAPGDGATVVTVRGDLTVHIPLLGGRVERAMVGNVGDEYEARAALFQEWLKDH